MDNYISTVLSKIKDEKIKSDIQVELEDHYNERVEYYTRIGYDKEIAETKANELFGEDAEIIGEQLALVNKKDSLLSIIFAIINVGLLLFPVVLFIPIIFALSGYYFYSYGAFVFSIFVSVFSFAELLVSLKSKSSYLSSFSILNFFLLGLCYLGYSPIVFCIYKILKGEAGVFVDLINNIYWRCSNIPIYVLCVAFYLLCIALSKFAGILINRFNECTYSKQNIKQEKALKIALLVLIVLFLVCLIYIAFYPYDINNSEYISLDGVYVIESDEMIPPQNVNNNNRHYLDVHWDWGNEPDAHADSSFVYYALYDEDVTDRYDKGADIYYTNYTLYGEFQPTKKYVCVIPIYYLAQFDDYLWIETTEEYVFESERDSARIKYKIRILPREAE